MGNEVQLLEHWRELTPQKQQKVLEFVELLKSESETTPPESDFVPQTNILSQKIMVNPTTSDRSLSDCNFVNVDEIELELAARRGGFCFVVRTSVLMTD